MKHVQLVALISILSWGIELCSLGKKLNSQSTPQLSGVKTGSSKKPVSMD